MIDLHTHNKNAANAAIINLYNDFDFVDINKKYSIGIHPWFTHHRVQKWEQITLLAPSTHIVAIGECGLDKLTETDWHLQIQIFKNHISLAHIVQKPLIIHCVKAWSECFQALKAATVPIVFHGFNNSLSIAKSIIQNGYYISFGKSLFKQNVQHILSNIPIEKIFFETDDSTFLIEEIYKTAATALNIEMNTLILQIQNNAKQFFGKDLFL